MSTYPIGTPGTPWGETEKAQWLAQQKVVRSYQEEVLSKLTTIPAGFELKQYGALPYDESRYPLNAVVPVSFTDNVPNILVTGGVHGYETSGVQGALKFINTALAGYQQKANVVVVPCVSPWGYETINRWNPMAMDPNRSFFADSPAPESAQIMSFVQSLGITFDMHIDLHETTDTDNSEFRPALAARDGVTHDNWNIPDGFYLVADTPKPAIAFQEAIIEKVRAITHIAPPDDNGKIIGADVISEGVICYDKSSLHLCGGMTGAQYVSTTEVYPDSANATPENCNDAQVAAVTAAIDYVCQQ
ncbi:M14 family metallocarboxypeptidase [Alteromonas sp. ASW11-19]|uniref:M14 family metallocarboxypeptidase n=1 Tax=Alteromonas salexigens TaxID=2982530 RepID=A0ABT2VPM8_9ALTE|nr:M14 family metallocarboxypeptidase [Alteromonas salexigens]MCU7555271.1 M14 family metallocarboxypeptidase [Alteromonas salexigens]